MNKRGFLRIVEASLAIVLILGVLFLFFTRNTQQSEIDLSERARDILEEMAREVELRQLVLDYDTELGPLALPPLQIRQFIEQRIPENFLEFEVRICEVEEACGKSEYTPGNIYSAERVISSTRTNLVPKKVRLFIWRVG